MMAGQPKAAAECVGAPKSLSISVAMATYNGAKYIGQQLDDLAAQTFLPAELIVCDDQSSDDTLAAVEDFAASAPFPVHVHRNPERLGYRANFMKAAGLCSSDLIAFCDQDDRWNARKLELLSEPFSDDDVLLAYHNARPVTDRGRILPLLYRGRLKRKYGPLAVDPWPNPMGFTQAFRRSLLRFAEFWPQSSDQNHKGERLAHDQWYFFLASALGSIMYVPTVLADYRQHGANVYGMSWYRTLAPQLNELWHATHKRKLRLDAAERRAHIFRQLSQRLTGKLQDRANEAAAWYEQLVSLGRMRAEVYDALSMGERMAALGRLVRAGGYGSRAPEFSRLTLAMDVAIGVTGLFPRVESVTRRLARR
jgi:glycosyltransferase involved in cell wall biosynthesis